jgi:hypothetical protein
MSHDDGFLSSAEKQWCQPRLSSIPLRVDDLRLESGSVGDVTPCRSAASNFLFTHRIRVVRFFLTPFGMLAIVKAQHAAGISENQSSAFLSVWLPGSSSKLSTGGDSKFNEESYSIGSVAYGRYLRGGTNSHSDR